MGAFLVELAQQVVDGPEKKKGRFSSIVWTRAARGAMPHLLISRTWSMLMSSNESSLERR